MTHLPLPKLLSLERPSNQEYLQRKKDESHAIYQYFPQIPLSHGIFHLSPLLATLSPSPLHLLSWLPLLTVDLCVNSPLFCHPSATALFFLSFLK